MFGSSEHQALGLSWSEPKIRWKKHALGQAASPRSTTPPTDPAELGRVLFMPPEGAVQVELSSWPCFYPFTRGKQWRWLCWALLTCSWLGSPALSSMVTVSSATRAMTQPVGPGAGEETRHRHGHAAREALGSASVGARNSLGEGGLWGLRPKHGWPRDAQAVVLFLRCHGSDASPWVCSPGYVTRCFRMRTRGCPTPCCGKPWQRALKTNRILTRFVETSLVAVCPFLLMRLLDKAFSGE